MHTWAGDVSEVRQLLLVQDWKTKFKAILDYSEFEVSLSYKGQSIQDPEHAKPTCSHWAILPTLVFITLTNQPFSECVHYSRSFMSSPNVSTAEHVITILSSSSPVTPFSQGPQPGTQPLPLLINPSHPTPPFYTFMISNGCLGYRLCLLKWALAM